MQPISILKYTIGLALATGNIVVACLTPEQTRAEGFRRAMWQWRGDSALIAKCLL